MRQDLYYNRYSLNLDAREAKVKVVELEVGGNERYLLADKEHTFMTNVTVYFPSLRAYDLNSQRA